MGKIDKLRSFGARYGDRYCLEKWRWRISDFGYNELSNLRRQQRGNFFVFGGLPECLNFQERFGILLERMIRSCGSMISSD